MNQEIFKDRFLFPMTDVDQSGKQRKLTIEPNVFQNSGECEALVLKYSFAKGEGLYFAANQMVFGAIVKAVEDVLRTKEVGQPTVFEYQPNPNKPAVKIAVGRDDDLRPFIAIAGDIQGKQRSKKFYWFVPKGYKITRGGQPVSDLEGCETVTRAFLGRAGLFFQMLEEAYKAREFNPGGGRGPQGGGNNNYRPPSGDVDFENMF